MLARHAREASAQARQRNRTPRRSCKPRHGLLVALPTSLAGLVGLWKYTSIARRRPTTTIVLPAAAMPLPAVVPFVVLFESSSGSSWLMQELSALPEVCAIGFEPIDNISMASAADHTLRLRWLRTLWTPQRASASEWLDWQAALQRASVFGQDDAIRRSLARCRRADAVAFGLKARLSRLLSDEPSMVRVAALMAEQGVRVVRLSRRNVIKQALAEYRRLHAGLGQFRRRSANASIPSIEVELRLFKRALQARWLSHTRNHARTMMHTRYLKDDLEPRSSFTCPALVVTAMHVFQAVSRSRRLSSRVLTYAPTQPLLSLSYEEMLGEHAAAMRRLAAFLGLPAAASSASATGGGEGSVSDGGGGGGGAAPPRYSKATPDRLCAAIANYRAVCEAYKGTAHAQHFDEACDTTCRERKA